MSTTEKRLITLKESDALRAMPAMNPQALLAVAVEKGASVETLERLVALAKDMRAISAREAFYQAKAEFQRRCPPITKSKTARITSRTGASYSYSYAPLDEIIAKVGPLLSELGLSISWKQRPEQNGVAASCVLSHVQGHEEESGFITMPYGAPDGRMNPAQLVGSALTYARRYSLLAILGLAPEDDDDAQGVGNGKDHRQRPEQPAPTPAPLDPDDPTLVDASHELFPDPEKDHLVAECGAIIKAALVAKTITQKDVRTMKQTYLGAEDANPEKCDVAALTDLRKYLAARFEKASAL